jgi:antitoxin component of MazEF toxin-antitoxin module
MIKNLTKHGNSYALIIDRPIMELLHIEPDTPLSLETDGKSITIRPVLPGDERSQRLQDSLAKINGRYGKVLKKLAE